MNDVTSDVERLQAQIAVMCGVLESVLIGAKHEAYFLQDRDPDVGWHEDDWAELVPEIEAALQPDDSETWQKRILGVQQMIISAQEWRETNVEFGPASTEAEKKRRQNERAQLTSKFIQAIDELDHAGCLNFSRA